MTDQRNSRRVIAEDTLHTLETGNFLSPAGSRIEIESELKNAVEGTIVYSPDAGDKLLQSLAIKNDFPALMQVTQETTLDASRRLWKEDERNAVILNFASAKNPGGGFLGGSQAQEESIARSSGLYPCLLKAQEYYSTNKHEKSCFYTDYMIYSPAVPVFKEESGTLMDEAIKVSVITAPAVNTGVVKQREKGRISEIEMVMKRRMRKILAIAMTHGHEVMVLGAWGCGVFQNDPEEVAKWFREVIDEGFGKAFRKIIFAIKSREEKMLQPFYENFGS